MLSQVEVDYILSLINTYQKQGYKYYLCNTITNPDSVYDIDIYFSKQEIKAINSNSFDFTNAIHLCVDSSNKSTSSYNYSVHARSRLVDSNVSDIINIDEAEFIYTNATVGENIVLINPDLLLNSAANFSNNMLLRSSVILCCLIFLYLFFSHILRLNK